MKKNVLVFPCGSEIGLEIYKSAKYSIHFNLIGGNSVPDHGRFVYEQYIGNLPFADDPGFIDQLNAIIAANQIDLLYPTMDSVMTRLTAAKDQLHCALVGSPAATNAICYSKKRTTEFLSSQIPMPQLLEGPGSVASYPVFLKPDSGYSGRGTAIATTKEMLASHLLKRPDCLIMEYLPGEEFTIDCFTDRKRSLLFAGPRRRSRISNGISVHTVEADESAATGLKELALRINELLTFRGAWFFQAKRATDGTLKVMEVAARLGGSSGLFRAKGVNFALLTLWDAIDADVAVVENKYSVEMDRALDNKFKIDLDFHKVYVDLDDTLVIDQKVNTELVAFLYQCRNEKKEVICVSRHDGDIEAELAAHRLTQVFDRIIHLKEKQAKATYMEPGAIFIDDSYAERMKVAGSLSIPVFSPDMIAALVK